MREIRLAAEPFRFISLQKMECRKELNGHGQLRMRGGHSAGLCREIQEYGIRRSLGDVRA